MALVAYSPVGRGLLTGTVMSAAEMAPDDFRRVALPRFSEADLSTNLRLVDAVKDVAAQIGATPAQAALAWLLAQDELVIPIPGTKRVKYLEENLAAAGFTLTPQQLAALSAAVPAEAVAGTRYAERAMQLLGQ